ncbi:MAG: hypothetical protein JWO41_204 [Candidatus Saccharibacteria bacterium]|nr:hypothetical protein [Candidatus Saccharibacteria bacterium]
MRWKNIAKSSTETEALEKRVDAMMDPSQADPGPAPQAKAKETIDIFEDPAAKSKLPNSWLNEVSKAAPTPTEVNTSQSTEIDDIATDRAVEAITQEEPKDFSAPKRPIEKHSRLRFLKNKRVWIPALVLLLAIAALPLTRYLLLGLVIKEPYTISVKDSKTGVVVSGAKVTLGNSVGETDGSGKVVLRAGVGSRTVTVTKANFTAATAKVFVGFTGTKQSTVQFVATGRSVPVKIVNSITGKPVANARIEVDKASAKTDSQGTATLVLSIGSGTKKATITTDGYNDLAVTIDVGIQQQKFKITPVGKLYFLSNKSGKIDVVKSDLDGSNRQTVLAGTGNEETATTSLIASRDWQYLVLKAKRDNNQAGLYLIDTATDKATQFESASNTISLVGWYGHTVIYDVLKGSSSAWQNGREAIKSYNAETSQLNQLDQNAAEGSSTSYGYEAFSDLHIVDNAIVYSVQWLASGGFDLSTKSASIRGMQPNGTAKKDYQTFPQSNITGIKSVVDAPGDIYYAVTATADGRATYYEYQNAAVTVNTNLDDAGFNKGYPTYLFSPSGTQTAWEETAGANHFFIGDNTGKRQKQIGNLSGLQPYAWFGENYIVATRGTGGLYIFSPTDKDSVSNPLRITDYFKTGQNYAGNSYSYGGF